MSQEARARLLIQLRQAEAAGEDPVLDRPLVAAMKRAFHDLVAGGMDSLADAWQSEVRRMAARSPRRGSIGVMLSREPWTRHPQVRVVDLDALDRR